MVWRWILQIGRSIKEIAVTKLVKIKRWGRNKLNKEKSPGVFDAPS